MFNIDSNRTLAKTCLVIALATGLSALGIASAYAQPPAGGRPKDGASQAPDRNADKAAALMSSLKLSAQQAAAVKTILDADRAATDALRQEMRTKNEAVHATTKQKLAKILNAEQLGRYEEFKQANRPPRPEGEPPRRD
jgi:hypothetical protein